MLPKHARDCRKIVRSRCKRSGAGATGPNLFMPEAGKLLPQCAKLLSNDGLPSLPAEETSIARPKQARDREGGAVSDFDTADTETAKPKQPKDRTDSSKPTAAISRADDRSPGLEMPSAETKESGQAMLRRDSGKPKLP